MLITPSFILAIYYPQVGTLAGILGGVMSMFCIYMLPIGTYLKMKWTRLNSKQQLEQENKKSRNMFIVEVSVGIVFASYGVFALVCQFLN